jgi:hypothetical protein
VRDSRYGSPSQTTSRESRSWRRATRRSARLRAPAPGSDDWPDYAPVTEAEIEVFEAWFGDLFDELFSTRH